MTTKERPILFNGEMVQAILDGRKTQTRRVIKPQPSLGRPWKQWVIDGETMDLPIAFCPYGIRDDHLWIRETWAARSHLNNRKPSQIANSCPILYYADGFIKNSYKAGRNLIATDFDKRRPSIFMPRWASRITLRIKRVWIERVQDISKDDAHAEGIGDRLYEHEWAGHCLATIAGGCDACANCDPISHFKYLWDTINKARGFEWVMNPWVWVVEFEVQKQ